MSKLPKGWAEVTLGALTEYLTSGSRDWSKYYATEGALFVRTQDINTNRLCDTSQIARVALPSAVEGKRTLIKRDDLLITITGANVGKCAHVTDDLPEAYVSQSVALVRLIEPSLASYLHRQLLAPEEANRTSLEIRAYGMGRPVLNLENVRDTPLKLAPLPEQKRIADKLDSTLARVEACRNRLDRLPALLKRFRQSILAAATSGRLTEDWRNAPNTTWCDHKLSELYLLIDGDRGPNYPKQHDYQTNGHCLFLSTKNVRPYGLLFEELTFISKEKHQQLKNGQVQVGDTILTTRGTLGNVAIFDAQVAARFPVTRINSGMLIVRERSPGKVKPNFLKLFIASPAFSLQLANKQTGSAQPQIPAGVLKGFDISVPPQNEQTEIVRRVETLFAFADRLEARLATARKQAEQLTPALLAKAFRGELVPQDPNDEPATELLKRLATTRSKAPKAMRGRKTAS